MSRPNAGLRPQPNQSSEFRVQGKKLVPCLCFLLNPAESGKHSKSLLIAILNRNCLTQLVKQLACKELIKFLGKQDRIDHMPDRFAGVHTPFLNPAVGLIP